MVPLKEPCALRSTQPLKVSTRDFSWGKGGRCVWLTTYHPCSAETSRKSGALIYPEPLGPPRPLAGDIYFTFYLIYFLRSVLQLFLLAVAKTYANLPALLNNLSSVSSHIYVFLCQRKTRKALILSVFSLVLTYLLTPWSRVLLEKLTGSAASQEIPRIFGTRRFITVLTSARQLSLS